MSSSSNLGTSNHRKDGARSIDKSDVRRQEKFKNLIKITGSKMHNTTDFHVHLYFADYHYL